MEVNEIARSHTAQFLLPFDLSSSYGVKVSLFKKICFYLKDSVNAQWAIFSSLSMGRGVFRPPSYLSD